MAKSDAVYYSPLAQGVKDLAVDIVVDQLAAHPVAKDATITYYYAGENRQRFIVGNLPQSETKLRDEILSLVSAFTEYLMPRPASTTFEGLTVKAERVATQIVGQPRTEYLQLIGVNPEKDAQIKEYRVLLDETGLAYQVENVLTDGTAVAARIDNVLVGDFWHIAKVTTRLPGRAGSTQWKIDSLDYAAVDGVVMPARMVTTYRDSFNRPVKGLAGLTVTFTNYRINTGAAAAAVPAQNPGTAETPAQP